MEKYILKIVTKDNGVEYIACDTHEKALEIRKTRVAIGNVIFAIIAQESVLEIAESHFTI